MFCVGKGIESVSNNSIIGSISKLRAIFSRKEKMTWIFIILFACFSSVLETITASSIVIFAQVLGRPEIVQQYLTKYGIIIDLSSSRVTFYAAILLGTGYIIKNVVAALEIFFQNFAIQRMSYRFKNKLLYGYAHSDYSFYLGRSAKTGIQILEGDTEQAFSIGLVSIAAILSELTVLIILIGFLIYIDPKLASYIFLLSSALLFIILKIFNPLFSKWGKALWESTGESGQKLEHFFSSFKSIVLSSKEEVFIEDFREQSRKRAIMQATIAGVNSLPRMFLEIVFVGIFVTAIAVMCLSHQTPSQMMGVLAGYLYVGFRVMPGLNRMLSNINMFKTIIPAIDRIRQEFLTTFTTTKRKDIPELRFDNSITFQNVDFAYANGENNVLQNITFKINKGDCVGIVGITGSGKSTLVDLILGLLRPTSGSILIDEKFPADSIQWQSKIGYVSQSIYLLSDTIQANIAFGEKQVNQERLQEAIEAAQLTSFVQSLPEGKDTMVGEHGRLLSGGEKQRIAIARALYKKPEVLIFDEATSALDNKTETALMKTIDKISENCTTIMVAHRITTLRNCNCILQIEDGKMAEMLTYAQLAENALH